MQLAQALHHSSGQRQPVNVVESGDEVEVTKLPHGTRPEALVGAPGSHVWGLRACRDADGGKCGCSPKMNSGGLLSDTEELQKAISVFAGYCYVPAEGT